MRWYGIANGLVSLVKFRVQCQPRVVRELLLWLRGRLQQEPHQLCAVLPVHHGVIHTYSTISVLGGWVSKTTVFRNLTVLLWKSLSHSEFYHYFCPIFRIRIIPSSFSRKALEDPDLDTKLLKIDPSVLIKILETWIKVSHHKNYKKTHLWQRALLMLVHWIV